MNGRLGLREETQNYCALSGCALYENILYGNTPALATGLLQCNHVFPSLRTPCFCSSNTRYVWRIVTNWNLSPDSSVFPSSWIWRMKALATCIIQSRSKNSFMASSKTEIKSECSDLPWGVSYKLLTMNKKYVPWYQMLWFMILY